MYTKEDILMEWKSELIDEGIIGENTEFKTLSDWLEYYGCQCDLDKNTQTIADYRNSPQKKIPPSSLTDLFSFLKFFFNAN